MNVVLNGSQIDQCVILSKSLLTLFPSSAHPITLHGTVLGNAHARLDTTMKGYIFDAYSYGYFRTLLIRVEEPGGNLRVLTVGGRNAIIEDIALESAEFQVAADVDRSSGLLERPAQNDWITDSYLLSLEFERADSVRQVLERIALTPGAGGAFSQARTWESQRVLTTRLKRLRALLNPERFVVAASNILRTAPTAEPDLFMFLCEAVWFWLEGGYLPQELAEPVERLLRIGLEHSDPNIRLASAISTAKYCAASSYNSEVGESLDLVGPLISSLGRLVSNGYLAASTYFEQVYRTCQYVLPSINDARQEFLLAGLEILRNVRQGEPGLVEWLDTVEDSRQLALILQVLLLRSPLVREIRMIDAPFESRGVDAFRIRVHQKGRDAFVYALCSIKPDPDPFSEWQEQATVNGLTHSQPMRLAARTTTLSDAVSDNIVCGGDLIALITSDARLQTELERLLPRN
jgi:hypothetical protein